MRAQGVANGCPGGMQALVDQGLLDGDQEVKGKHAQEDVGVDPALQVMEEFKLDSLPVSDSAGRFIGTVERAKLTTSLILAVTEKLSDEKSNGNK